MATTILVLLTSSPQHVQSKARSKSGVVELPHPKSANVSIRYVVQESILINSMYTLAPSLALPKAGSCGTVGGQTQHLNGMPYGVRPSTSETVASNSSEGPEHI